LEQSDFGFDITSVGTVKDALTNIRSEQFDILVSDLNLPEPNAGFTVIEEMRKAQPSRINFILTGYPADETADLCANVFHNSSANYTQTGQQLRAWPLR
jgi:CheY-like chemotaxis protein